MCLVRHWRTSVLVLLLGMLLALVAGDAQASTAFADISLNEDDYFGPVRFTAAPGEKNRLTVAPGGAGIVFRDAGSRVHATGQCESLGRHAATCPISEDVPSISLRDRNDRAKLRAGVSAEVAGGAGNDVLRGGGGYDSLNGGPGRDRLFGGRGGDTLVDGETDSQAAPDVFDGGPDASADTVDFSMRRKSLRINLMGGRTSTRDTMVGIEDVTGGSGNDRIVGDAEANTLAGGPGRDVLRGGAGHDVPMGGPGADRVSGGNGDDVVWGGRGHDRLSGGAGNDLLESNEANEGATARPGASDEVACGDGADSAVSDASDTLEPACEQLWAAGAQVETVPALHDGRADFTLGCGPGPFAACAGTLELHSLTGEEYGKSGFDLPLSGTTTVSVPLGAAGIAALTAGTLVEIDLRPSGSDASAIPGGDRMFLRSG